MDGITAVNLIVSSSGLATALAGLMIALKVYKIVTEFQAKAARADPPPVKKKVLVPGKGIFSMQKTKKKPTWWSEEEIWAREQDEKRR